MKINLLKSSVTLTLLSALSILTSRSTSAAQITIGDFSWFNAKSVTNVTVVEGALENPVLAPQFGTSGTAAGSGFNANTSIGRLIPGYTPSNAGPNDSVAAAFPDIGIGSAPNPNVVRTTLELTWGGTLIPNDLGEELIIYEIGSAGGPEGFALSVRPAGGSFTQYRYKIPSSFDNPNTAFATVFDLSDFGLAPGASIDAIRIRNLFNSQAAAGRDLTTDPNGQNGYVLYPGDPNYGSGFTIVGGLLANGSPSFVNTEYPTNRLDADIVYVGALEPVPFEFSPALGLLTLGIWGTIAYRRNQSRNRSNSKTK